MSEQKLIPSVQVPSGEKFVNDKGITAIKDGIKSSAGASAGLRKPDWLRIPFWRLPRFQRHTQSEAFRRRR